MRFSRVRSGDFRTLRQGVLSDSVWIENRHRVLSFLQFYQDGPRTASRIFVASFTAHCCFSDKTKGGTRRLAVHSEVAVE